MRVRPAPTIAERLIQRTLDTFPGMRAAQYALGKEVVTGRPILRGQAAEAIGAWLSWIPGSGTFPHAVRDARDALDLLLR